MDQMSVVERHVSVRESKSEITESFLGFIALTNQSADKITNEVCNFMEINKNRSEKLQRSRL